VGKRSKFQRLDHDLYDTPLEAVLPLIPYLRRVKTFAEPCAGNGRLVEHLEAFGLRCVYSGDLSTGQDALDLEHFHGADAAITNPPYSREPMHALIAHFAQIGPAWLLLEADWLHTKQAAPFMPMCSDVVSIGRLKWIENSRHSGKDNFAWMLFDARHTGGALFHARGSEPPRLHRACDACGRAYAPRRSTSRFCSATCRKAGHRAALSVAVA
jgi:hypothetical protein